MVTIVKELYPNKVNCVKHKNNKKCHGASFPVLYDCKLKLKLKLWVAVSH